MIQLRTSKVLATVLLGIVLGAFVYHDQTRWLALGRANFLAAQNHRYDRAVSHPHALIGLVLAGVLGTAMLVVVYELLAMGIGRAVPGFAGRGGKEL